LSSPDDGGVLRNDPRESTMAALLDRRITDYVDLLLSAEYVIQRVNGTEFAKLSEHWFLPHCERESKLVLHCAVC